LAGKHRGKVKMNYRTASVIITAWVQIAVSPLYGEGPSAREFTRRMVEVLPLEKSFDYHRFLESSSIHEFKRDDDARPESGEIAIPDTGWKLVISSGSGQVLKNAAEDFREYLEESMSVRVSLETVPSLRQWDKTKGAIVVGTAEQMPGCGNSLKGEKDYRLKVSDQLVAVCGFDERGAMFGLFNLEQRMNLREAPYLPADLDLTRNSKYRTRMALSWMGWMEWPDRLLARMAHDGFDAIYASVYANPNGAPGPPLRGTDLYSLILFRNKEQKPERVHDLIRRASRFGLKVYTPIIYRYTGTPENVEGLRKLVRDIVTEFPEIHGYVLLTEGFYYEDWGHRENLEEWTDRWTEGVQVVVEECHKLNPKLEILAWEYNIDFRPKQAPLKRQVISRLPKESIPLLTWENGKSFEIEGLKGFLRDYSINQVGPAEVTIAQLEEARNRGMTVYSKVDTFASWQFGTIPYLPVPYQWQRRYDALERYGIEGTHESWSNGYKPNFIAELRSWSCWTGSPQLDELLRGLARRQFGKGNEELVLAAWREFSEAIQLVPDTGPYMGTNNAVANPLFFEEAVPRTMTLRYSWRDPVKWQGYFGASINPVWPYTVARMVFYPDFTNQVNKAEQYALSVSGIGSYDDATQGTPDQVLRVFLSYLRRAADGLEVGLKSYRQAAFQAPPEKRVRAFREVLVTEQMQRMLRSDATILEFEDLRFRLVKTEDRSQKREVLNRLAELLMEEIERTEASLEATLRDSRLGFEFEQDYIYTPYVLKEKLALLRETLTTQLPAYRSEHALP
jgi:hypothetical protein